MVDSALRVASCDRCANPAILHQRYSGRHYCQLHLNDSIRRRVSKELRKQLDLPSRLPTASQPHRILVAISGGKDSAVLLEMLVRLLGPRRDVELIAGSVDEIIEGYRSPSLECAKELADTLGVRWEQISYTDIGFIGMDELVSKIPQIGENVAQTKGMLPCSWCGVFRRQGLNALAKRVGADWMALGHNLDDMAQTVLMNMQKGDIERVIRLAPHGGSPVEGLVPRIVPLRWIPEQEVHAYAIGADLPFHHSDCPHVEGALRQRHREVVAKMEQDVPGTRHGLVHAMDSIKELYQSVQPTEGAAGQLKKARKCVRCSEVTSQELCQACQMRDWIILSEEE